jgi:hypothetical protein
MKWHPQDSLHLNLILYQLKFFIFWNWSVVFCVRYTLEMAGSTTAGLRFNYGMEVIMSAVGTLPSIDEATQAFIKYKSVADKLANAHFQVAVGPLYFELFKTALGHEVKTVEGNKSVFIMLSSCGSCLYNKHQPETVEAIRKIGQKIIAEKRALSF